MKKLVLSNAEFKGCVSSILRQMMQDKWVPDYIVGITRGGLTPAVMLSQYLNVPMHTLNVSLRDNSGLGPESNLWMAEDAYGYPRNEKTVNDPNDVGAILEAASDLLSEGDNCKNILIVDDINDTGATLDWIIEDWKSSCLPNDPEWEYVWNNNVRFAVIVDNLSSNCKVKMDYVGMEVNKAEDDVWVEFPYENWWNK